MSEKFAVIETGGKQYCVSNNDIIDIETFDGCEEGKKVSFDKILLLEDGGKTTIGKPYVSGKKIGGEVLKVGKKKKINVLKRYDFGKATLVVAIPDPWIDVQTVADLEEIAFEFKDKKKKRLRVATKYPNLTREFLFSKGVTQFKLIDSLGATEAYPFTGSSEIITDITSTGETLKANNLRILKDGEILRSQACMMISKSSNTKMGLKKIVKLLSKN